MYEVQASIIGTEPILQNRFAPDLIESLMQGSKKKTGSVDYSQEWLKGMYVTDEGYLCQLDRHLEGALIEAAKAFRIKGRGRKTWRDTIKAYCRVRPKQILHLYQGDPIPAPTSELIMNPTEHLSVNVQRVTVGRSAVARARLEIASGWRLQFTLEIRDEQITPEVVRQILAEAGLAIGIGDFRPKYGLFEIETFAPQM